MYELNKYYANKNEFLLQRYLIEHEFLSATAYLGGVFFSVLFSVCLFRPFFLVDRCFCFFLIYNTII